jgi:hypothetical protein
VTATQWLSCNDLTKALAFLRRSHKAAQTKAGRRKLRLLACACCRALFWHVPVLDCYRQVVKSSERFADGLMTRAELSEVVARCPSPHQLPNRRKEDEIYFASWAMSETGRVMVKYAVAYSVYRLAFVRDFSRARTLPPRTAALVWTKRLCDLLRDIFGNPFRPEVIDAAWLLWKDGAVAKIAHSIYADRDFESLPVLADALEEAGCSNAAILSHCRTPAEHARGCWVLDLLLGKA